ncbi:exopolygalacturonase-like [Mangifera indica]|uniref:exopolygalacturonase-like n=1 Tax=Mangifera indica TaxID=29780 RepID=UPI001CFA7F8A|nr:exopolygalacturonase-like [Mangifera indica]
MSTSGTTKEETSRGVDTSSPDEVDVKEEDWGLIIFIRQRHCTVVVQAKCRKCSSAHKSKSRPVPSPRLPPPPSPDKNFPGAIFHVTEYGAVADGETDSTSAFLTAWEAACDHGGSSTFYIPEGKFLLGPITFSGPCHKSQPPNVRIRGTLLAVPHLSAYPADDWIVFNNLHGFNLIGDNDEAILDGQGGLDAWKQESCVQSANCDRLITSVKFNNVSNGTISDITVTNSKAFHISFNNCDQMDMYNVNIKAPGDSPNTDGIHFHESTNINIVSADIGVGDDCVSFGPGSINISVSDIRCGPGHGISVGSLGKYQNEADVVGVVVRNCTISNTQNGVRVKTWPGSPESVASNFTFEDIVMINVSNPIIIDQEYCPSGSCEDSGPSKVKISNMYFKNITGTYNTQTGVSLLCSSGVPCENIHLADINMQYIKRETRGQGHFNVKGVVHGLEILTSSF